MKNKVRYKGFQAFSICLLSVVCLLILLPFLLMFLSSVTEEKTLLIHGYSFLPDKFSLEAYRYIFRSSGMILRSYGISAFVTLTGTVVALLLTCLTAYPLSRKDFRFRNVLSFFVFFTMLFNGGLVSQYMLWTQVIKIRDTVLAYLIPNLLMNSFNVMIVCNYYANNIPHEIIESARMDGSGELNTFLKLVMPMSTPIMAAIGLLIALGYWNDWTNGLYYISNPDLYTFQNLLNRMIQQINFLSSGQASQYMTGSVQVPSVGVRMGIASIGVLPILMIYPFFQKYFAKGLTMGAVKG